MFLLDRQLNMLRLIRVWKYFRDHWGTQPLFARQGACTKGEACTFAHGPEEIGALLPDQRLVASRQCQQTLEIRRRFQWPSNQFFKEPCTFDPCLIGAGDLLGIGVLILFSRYEPNTIPHDGFFIQFIEGAMTNCNHGLHHAYFNTFFILDYLNFISTSDTSGRHFGIVESRVNQVYETSQDI